MGGGGKVLSTVATYHIGNERYVINNTTHVGNERYAINNTTHVGNERYAINITTHVGSERYVINNTTCVGNERYVINNSSYLPQHIMLEVRGIVATTGNVNFLELLKHSPRR